MSGKPITFFDHINVAETDHGYNIIVPDFLKIIIRDCAHHEQKGDTEWIKHMLSDLIDYDMHHHHFTIPTDDKIKSLNLSTRTINMLRRNGIISYDVLANLPDAELSKLPGCGSGSLAEIRQALAITNRL